MKTIDIISLGCSKNLVDSEQLMGLMEANGYHCTHDSDDPQGEIVVVNTCGFIADAKEESINTILEFAQAKTEGRIEKLFVMGCLSERYLADLEKEIPEVDGWYGKFNYKQLLSDLEGERREGDYHRHITTPPHYTYIKISEGCDRHCAYCAIPLITGRHQSRPMDEILDEVRYLVGQGVKEFNVIAQELTYYGIDIDGKQHIAELIERMADIPGVAWIRLHYAYPAHFPWDLLRVMREKQNVCKYLDIALQHISDNMLTIAGAPDEFGTSSPAYGQTTGLAANTPLTLSMAATAVPGEGTVTNYLKGWKLESVNVETAARTLVRSSASAGFTVPV